MKFDKYGRAPLTYSVLKIAGIEKGDILYVSATGNAVYLSDEISYGETALGTVRVDDKARVCLPKQIRSRFEGLEYIAEGKYKYGKIELHFDVKN